MALYLLTLDLKFYYMVHLSLLHFSLSPSNTHQSFSTNKKTWWGSTVTLSSDLKITPIERIILECSELVCIRLCSKCRLYVEI